MTASAYFSLENGELRISHDTPSAEWKGRPDGLAVLELQVSPDRTSAILLLDPPVRSGPVHNLVKIGSSSDILWRAELPNGGPNDCFVGFKLNTDGSVTASTWGGYRVHVSGESGKLLSSEFTK